MYLKRCIDSVINQTYSKLEIILVDDGSTDSSGILCDQLKEIDYRIIVIHKENGGLSSARNTEIEAAHGDYITFLDSDDWITIDCYEYMLALVTFNDADVADIMTVQVNDWQNADILSDDERIEVLYGRDILVHYLTRGMSEQNGAPFAVWRKLYKRSLIIENRILFEEGIINEDICFNFLVLSRTSSIAVSNQKKHYYYQGDASISKGALKKRDFDLLHVSKELSLMAEEIGDAEIIELAKMKEARSDFSLLTRAALYGMEIVNGRELTSAMLKRLRCNYLLLMKSPMSVLRKILLTGYIVNYRITSNLMKLILGGKKSV